eukprot:660093-Amphidinium_carterae.2
MRDLGERLTANAINIQIASRNGGVGSTTASPPPPKPQLSVTTQPRMVDGGPIPNMKPPPTSRPPRPPPRPVFPEHYDSADDQEPRYLVGSVNTTPPPNWEESVMNAAMRAREVIQTVQKQLAPKPPAVKPPPAGFEHLVNAVAKDVSSVVKPVPKGPPSNLVKGPPQPPCLFYDVKCKLRQNQSLQ